jgi:hypothetical protein
MTTASVSRSPTAAEVLRLAISGALENVHVALPGRIEEWDPAQQKASVKPLVKRLIAAEDGEEILEELPVLTDVPVLFPRSSEFFLSLPLAPGDFVLLVFCERSIDAWTAGSGDDTDPNDFRRHDLSDAVALPGFYPFAKALADVSASTMALGKTGGPQVHVDGAAVHLGAYPATDFVALAAATEARLTALEVALGAGGHTHAGVAPGPGVTGPPLPPVVPGSPVAATKAKAT